MATKFNQYHEILLAQYIYGVRTTEEDVFAGIQTSFAKAMGVSTRDEDYVAATESKAAFVEYMKSFDKHDLLAFLQKLADRETIAVSSRAAKALIRSEGGTPTRAPREEAPARRTRKTAQKEVPARKAPVREAASGSLKIVIAGNAVKLIQALGIDDADATFDGKTPIVEKKQFTLVAKQGLVTLVGINEEDLPLATKWLRVRLEEAPAAIKRAHVETRRGAAIDERIMKRAHVIETRGGYSIEAA